MRARTAILLGIGAVGTGALAACGSTTTSTETTPSATHGSPVATGSDSHPFKSGQLPTTSQLKAAFKGVAPRAGEIPVVWRMDDIQAWFCSSIFDDITAPFTSTNTPLSLGIIGNGLTADNTIVSDLQALKTNPTIEFANHSFTHPSGGLPSLGGETVQQNDLQEDQDMINTVVGAPAATFIPPDNAYDANTVQAATNVGLTNISAQCTWSAPGQTEFCPDGSKVVWPNLTWQQLTSMPAGAVIDDWTDFSQPASVDTAMAWANAQITNQGFAVFMLHPQELATDGGSACATPDTTKLQVISDVITQGKAKGWHFYTFNQMAAAAKAAAAKAAAKH